jgi:hypothetical protein
MPFCTIVEFEWNATFDRDRFASLTSTPAGGNRVPPGRLAAITGIDGSGARIIEVWGSAEDARAFAEQTGPELAASDWPAPSRVSAFEVTSYVVS